MLQFGRINLTINLLPSAKFQLHVLKIWLISSSKYFYDRICNKFFFRVFLFFSKSDYTICFCLSIKEAKAREGALERYSCYRSATIITPME